MVFVAANSVNLFGALHFDCERHTKMMFTIEFFRIRKEDNARAMLDRITHIASDLESAKIKAKSLFDTLNMPQNPMACGFWTRMGTRCSFGRRGRRVPRDPDGENRRN
jgi:hypothetical protein